MEKAKADINNNVLYIKFAGFISGETMSKIDKEIFAEAEKLTPGFHVITDMTQFKIGNSDALSIAQKTIVKLAKMKVGKIIRVIGSSQNAVVQSAAITQGVDGYEVEYVPTLEEAYQILNIQK